MRFEAFSEDKHGLWVSRHIECNFCSDSRGIMAVRDDGRIAGGVILSDWTFSSVVAHFGTESPIVWRNGFHKVVVDYVFNTGNRSIILGAIAANNVRAIKTVKHLGFTETCRIKDGYAEDIDYVLLQLRKENCDYYEERDDG